MLSTTDCKTTKKTECQRERELPSSNEMKRRKIAILNFLLADVLNVLPSSVRRGLFSYEVLISHVATVVCIVKDRNAEKAENF